MRALLITAVAALAVCGCRSQRAAVSGVSTSDSVRTEVRWRTEIVRDTVEVAVPLRTAERETRDSVSELSTGHGSSVVRLLPSGGYLHTLSTGGFSEPCDIPHIIEWRDSVVWRDREVAVTQTVEVERELSWWQRTQIYGFWVAIALALLYFFGRKWIKKLTDLF